MIGFYSGKTEISLILILPTQPGALNFFTAQYGFQSLKYKGFYFKLSLLNISKGQEFSCYYPNKLNPLPGDKRLTEFTDEFSDKNGEKSEKVILSITPVWRRNRTL